MIADAIAETSAGAEPHRDLLPPITTPAQLRAALHQPVAPVRRPLGELLVEHAGLDAQAVGAALGAQGTGEGTRLGQLLLERGLVADRDLYTLLSHQLGLPLVHLADFEIDPRALLMLPQQVARSVGALPLIIEAERLVVAMSDPGDAHALHTLRFAAGCPIEAVLATPDEIRAGIAKHYPPFEDAAITEHCKALYGSAEPQAQQSPQSAKAAPIVRLVTNLLHDAVDRQASDIHIRPGENSAEALLRIDGALVSVREFAKPLLPSIMARIKVLSGINLAEHRLPQDGALRLQIGKHAVDMRVSVLPTIHGESAAIRVLDPRMALRSFDSIGFLPADATRLRRMLNRNQGLVLVTGPTGSGKTTTLYAGLQELNTGELQIITIEDPVEYRLAKVLQIQVQPAINYGFATALRHILRHDPDVILIGEIRDRDTARIAVESALTGHLVLSTLHTNSAAQTVTRLLDMGVEPYLVSATLAGVLAQRLVRRNCMGCLQPESVEPAILEAVGANAGDTFWRGAGCDECGGQGHHGRLAVYELLEITPSVRAAINAHLSDDELQAIAEREGMVRLTARALELARARLISVAEVYRTRLDG